MQDHIHESNLIEGINLALADRQCLQAWLYLLTCPELTHEVIQTVQKKIVGHQTDLKPREKGYYRTINVRVGGKLCPSPALVPELIHNWLLDYDTMTPIDAHVRFEKIHPFVDGNGRTGRMLMWWHELHTGQLPTLLKSSEKYDEYYPLFR